MTHNVACRCDETLRWTGAPAPEEIAKTAERLLLEERFSDGLDFLYRALDGEILFVDLLPVSIEPFPTSGTRRGVTLSVGQFTWR